MKSLIDYLGSRKFAVILLIFTTTVILIANFLPNTVLMTPPEAERFISQRPLLYKISNTFQVMNITKSPFFLSIPIFIMLSISICTIKRIRVKIRGFNREEDMFDSSQLKAPCIGALKREINVQNILIAKGWKVAKREDEGSLLFYGKKGTGGIWGSLLFHAGMEIVIVGAIVSMSTLFYGKIFMTEGFEIGGQELFKGMGRANELRGFPYERMLLASFTATYEKDFSPVDYSAVVKTLDKKGRAGEATVGVNQPLKEDGYQFVLENYYFTPRFVITEKSGRVLEDAYINLRVRDIKETDWFSIPDAGITIRGRFFPDFHKEGKELTTRSMNLNNPVFILEFFKGGEKIGDGILPIYKRMDFYEGRYTIEFKDLKKWIILSVSRDTGLPIVQMGVILIVIGLVARFILNEKRLWVVVKEEEGRIEMGGRAIYFPALFEEEMRRLAEELGLVYKTG